jgi:hypothetical protein
MAQSGKSGDYSVRSLAEILQEHGLESEFGTRPGRRRREDEPKADWPARPAPEDQPRSKLRPAPDPSPGTTPPRAAPARAAAPYAEILREHGLESEFGTRPGRRGEGEPEGGQPRRPAPEDQARGTRRRSAGPAPREAAARANTPRAVPGSDLAAPTAPPRNSPGRSVPARTPAPRTPAAAVAPGPRGPAKPPPPDVPMYGRRSTDAPLPPSLAPEAMPSPSGPSTAAIPALRASRRAATDGGTPAAGEDAEGRPDTAEPTGRESALAWARFAGEMVLALAAGIGIYFAFTVLWELLPYAALVAAPLTVTGLVAGVSAWRHRRNQAQLGVPLLAVLLFAGTLLVIAPAAALLAGS